MTIRTRLNLALGVLLLSGILLLLGVCLPVITIRGVLVTDGLADVVVDAMAAKAPEDQKAQFTGPERQKAKQEISGFIGNFLPRDDAQDIYIQTRSIVGSIYTLYDNGAWFAPTLILLFSLCVPLGKGTLLYVSLINAQGEKRARLLRIINAIGKWSMADVFVVAIFIAYLAAKATAGTNQAVAFKSEFGPGFYFFTAYCIVSLIGQQLAQAVIRADDPLPSHNFRIWWRTGIGLFIGFSVSVAAFLLSLGAAVSNDLKSWVGDFPTGLTFGIFVLAPFAVRFENSAIRALMVILYSHALYSLMAKWAEMNTEWFILHGAVQGCVGAALLLLGLRRLLQFRFSARDFIATLLLSFGFGFAVLFGWNWGGFYWGQLLWQVTIAVMIVRWSLASQAQPGVSDVSVWHYRFSPLLPVVIICAFLCIALGGSAATVRRLAGLPRTFSPTEPVEAVSFPNKAEISYQAGHLSVESFEASGSQFAKINGAIDWSADISLSVTAIWFSGNLDGAYGLYWDRRDNRNYSYFAVTATGQVRIAQVVDGQSNGAWKQLDHSFNRQSSNRLSILRTAGKMEFRINDTPVSTLPAGAISNDDFGFLVGGMQKVLFDDLKITAFPKR